MIKCAYCNQVLNKHSMEQKIQCLKRLSQKKELRLQRLYSQRIDMCNDKK